MHAPLGSPYSKAIWHVADFKTCGRAFKVQSLTIQVQLSSKLVLTISLYSSQHSVLRNYEDKNWFQ